MVSVCQPSDALLQHLPSYLGFSYLGHRVSLYGCSSKAQPLLLTLDEGFLLTSTLPDLQRGIAPLGPPAPTQPLLLGRGFAPPGYRSWPQTWDGSSRPSCTHAATGPCMWGCSSRPLPLASGMGWLLPAAAPGLRCGVTLLGCCPSGMGSSPLLPMTSDVGYLLSAVLSVSVAACA